MSEDNTEKKEYEFGGIKEYSLEEIEAEVLNDSTYLDVFAGCDMRFKEEMTPVRNALRTVNKMDAINFKYKEEFVESKGFTQNPAVGFVAQELVQVAPWAVARDNEGHLYVNNANLVPHLVQAVKELTEMVNDLKREIAELKEEK